MDARPVARTARSAAVATGALLLCAAGLQLCWMAAAAPLQALRSTGPDAPDDLIIVGAAGAAAAVLVWLGVGAVVAALAAAPGAVGRLASAAAARIAPGALRRVVAVLLGTALATAPIPVAHAAGPQPLPSADTTTSQAVTPPAPDPSFGVTRRPPVADGRPDDPAGSVPTAVVATAPDPGFGASMPTPTSPPAGSVVHSPATAPKLGPLGPAPHRPSATASGTVTVVRGDTLWVIAARHLGPHASPLEVAREWPRWYAANRTVIGPNPNLLRVGQVLTVPTPGASS